MNEAGRAAPDRTPGLDWLGVHGLPPKEPGLLELKMTVQVTLHIPLLAGVILQNQGPPPPSPASAEWLSEMHANARALQPCLGIFFDESGRYSPPPVTRTRAQGR